MRTLVFGAMTAGLLGLAGAGSTAAQAVTPDGWWSGNYSERQDVVARERSGEIGAGRLERTRGAARADARGGVRGGVRGSDGRFYDAYDEYDDYDDGRYYEGGYGARDDARYDVPYDARYDVRYDRYDRSDDRWDHPYRDGRYDGRGRVQVRGSNGRIGYRLPGRVRVHVRPSERFRPGHAPVVYWNEVYWNVTFRERWVGHGHRKLKHIVGNRTAKQIQRHARELGARGPLTYRWVDLGHRGIVLQVRAGRMPVAELIDYGRDCYVDVVRLSGFW